MTEVVVTQADRPVGDWLADLFAVADDERRKLCSDASGEGGDPPCWRVLPDAYKNEECSAGCGTRAILARLTAYQGRVERLEEALRPFAHYCDINDCDQRTGNIEVPVADLRRAREALADEQFPLQNQADSAMKGGPE